LSRPGVQSRFANRCQVDLAELHNEPWILTPPGSWNYRCVAEAFRVRGFTVPKISLMTFSIHLRANLLTTGAYNLGLPEHVLAPQCRPVRHEALAGPFACPTLAGCNRDAEEQNFEPARPALHRSCPSFQPLDGCRADVRANACLITGAPPLPSPPTCEARTLVAGQRHAVTEMIALCGHGLERQLIRRVQTDTGLRHSSASDSARSNNF